MLSFWLQELDLAAYCLSNASMNGSNFKNIVSTPYHLPLFIVDTILSHSEQVFLQWLISNQFSTASSKTAFPSTLGNSNGNFNVTFFPSLRRPLSKAGRSSTVECDLCRPRKRTWHSHDITELRCCLSIKVRPSAQPFIWMIEVSFSYETVGTKTRSEKEAKGNLEMAIMMFQDGASLYSCAK